MIKADVAIKALMEEKQIASTRIAEQMGMSRQSLNQYLTRKPESLRLDVFQGILDILGYELQIVKKPEE